MLFDETVPGGWWVGISLVAVGMVLVNDPGDDASRATAPPPPPPPPDRGTNRGHCRGRGRGRGRGKVKAR